MYLTKITTNINDIHKFTLYDNYRWKQEICNSVPPTLKNESRTFLFRVIQKGQDGTEVYLLSKSYPKILSFGIWDVHKIADNFYKHKRYFFDLVANAVKRISTPKGEKDGKRVGIRIENNENWIKRKLREEGASDVECVTCQNLGIWVTPHRGLEDAKHSLVKFCGILKVNDSKKFQKSVFDGYGSSKSFGYGLMLLKPI